MTNTATLSPSTTILITKLAHERDYFLRRQEQAWARAARDTFAVRVWSAAADRFGRQAALLQDDLLEWMGVAA